MADSILKCEQLKNALGLEPGAQNAAVKRRLESQGIACFDGKDGVWTTLELVKVAGLVKLGLYKSENTESII